MEPIAIIGLGCRFPGAADPEALWRLLAEGGDAITAVTPERTLLRTYYDSDATAPGKLNSCWGGFVEGVDRFDLDFFSIPPAEAAGMDPQQRLLLQVAWEALEDAGQVPERLAGTPVEVFVGVAGGDYGWMQMSQLGLSDQYSNTGSMLTFVANRLSYAFDFRGPSAVVASGCSASLLAVHLACQSLWTADTTLALAGGVNLILAPPLSVGPSLIPGREDRAALLGALHPWLSGGLGPALPGRGPLCAAAPLPLAAPALLERGGGSGKPWRRSPVPGGRRRQVRERVVHRGRARLRRGSCRR